MNDQQRGAFEKWCFNDTPNSPNFNTERNALGDYASPQTDGAWHAWQHLASLTQPQAQQALSDMEARKDAAYLERNQVVAALAKCFPSGVARTAIEGWSEDWHGCVYIDLPTGQASWHFHDSQAHLFDDLPQYQGEWDGHTTEEKYERIAALKAQQAAAVPAGYRLLKDSTHIERSWPEDSKHENGNYSNTCRECLRDFIGYKRRIVCKVCATAAPPAPVLPLSDGRIDKIREALVEKMMATGMLVGDDAWDHSLARSIERAHGITAHGAGGEPT